MRQPSRMRQPRYWTGPAPVHCDLCNAEITDTFYDAGLPRGPWGFFCNDCFTQNALKLGTGYGQKYEKQADGKWLKTGG